MIRVDHLAVLVRDLEQALKVYEALTGKPADLRGEDPDLGARTALVKMGDTVLELMELHQWGRRGSHRDGLHHVAFRVGNLQEVLERLARAGIRPLDREPREEGGTLAVFLKPEDTAGILTELVQR
jgi:methylmalonyl-CoA/ethylmalonyl-CoA epimerase